MRTCVGCRRRHEVALLVRVVRRPDGSVAIGRTLPGRGAWLCAGSLACVQRAARRNALTRALRAPVSPEAVLALGQPGSPAPRGPRTDPSRADPQVRARMDDRGAATSPHRAPKDDPPKD